MAGSTQSTSRQGLWRSVLSLATLPGSAPSALLVALLALTVSCAPRPVTPVTSPANLDVDIDYTGTWYRETFGYTREAENVLHVVVVLPVAEYAAGRTAADQVFGGLTYARHREFRPPESLPPPPYLLIQDCRQNAWVLPYLRIAPGGRLTGEFHPGTYYMATALLFAPLSRTDARIRDDEDVSLYPGCTGGVVATSYRKIDLSPGGNRIRIELTDADGWACPWLYVLGHHGLERRTEVLRNLRGSGSAQGETTVLGQVDIIDGAITLVLAEEKAETAYVDHIAITVDGTAVPVELDSDAARRVADLDRTYLVIAAGEAQTFRFRLPAVLAGRERAAVTVVAHGYYVPQGVPGKQ